MIPKRYLHFFSVSHGLLGCLLKQFDPRLPDGLHSKLSRTVRVTELPLPPINPPNPLRRESSIATLGGGRLAIAPQRERFASSCACHTPTVGIHLMLSR